ncbi:hypothetical protein [Yoonia sediminilitoris]|uniref:Transferrin-binding protein B C-lobe/N-lobe beta barrel domain-containing protein n=1 Tax=Yoonia sediminilitoris TaxID=1286148 RepID=A0A2T6KLH9_9RHOB|nr:hypothetical protein [Yoonia sediminilitoris]PUB17070.1 hypothetical protein C8N45_10280 [Yoonia sediminilitoris]RCW97365.1 hypothetical protein DFP92_10280 [Yoonia sediminilitoris]
MTSFTKTLLTLAGCTLLAACGGGGGGDDGPRTVFTNQPLDSRVPGESTIAAAGVVQDPFSGRAANVQVVLGSLDRPTQELDLRELIENGEQIGENAWRSGSQTVTPVEDGAFASSNFAFLVPVNVTTDGDVAGTYIVGVVSRTQDLPSSGSATFRGPASVSTLLGGTGGASYAKASGDATITASFRNETVDLLVEDFSGDTMPFGSIEISDMQISNDSNATFASNGGSSYDIGSGDIVGENARLDAEGAFYGGDSNGPAEAGGAFLIKGDDGEVFGVFAGN